MPATRRDLRQLTYNDACGVLCGRASRLIAPNTKLETIDSNTIGVRLHETTIIKIHHNGTYTLSSGGFRTATTKQRINALTPANIFVHRGAWFLGSLGNCVPFVDGMVVSSNGTPVRAGPSVSARIAAIRAEIAALAKQINVKRAELSEAKAMLPGGATVAA